MPQDFPWVDPDSSLQWRFFQRTIATLRQRGNRVFVLIGPFNEHMLTEKSLRRYRLVIAGMEKRLHEEGVPFVTPRLCPAANTATPAIRWLPATRRSPACSGRFSTRSTISHLRHP